MSFKNIFDNGGDQAGSADKSAEALNKDTPGAGDISDAVRKLESERDPWLVRQTAHGAFDVMGFLNPLFQNAQGAAAAQRQVSEDPGSTSTMASSTTKAFGPPKVSIGDDDMPKLEDLSKLIGNSRGYALIATGLGTSEGLAVDPSLNTAYVADRGGKKLSAVKVGTGAQRPAASTLGDIGDVELDGQGTAYTTDCDGGRLLAVDLSSGSSRKIADVPGAYGVALDAAGKAHVASWRDGQLIVVDLPGGQKTTIATGLGKGIGGVALDGQGKAYIGQKEGSGKLYEVDLANGTNRVVTSLSGASTIRVALDGAGRAYTIDHLNGRLYEITLADGAQRVVATGLGTCEGLALDTVNGWIYVSNREGQLWQINQRATQVQGGVGKVMA
ncbi:MULTISPECIES: SMP-30/gluconolactonase/LRE family protein [unclassified Streptomyces]|uniref:SMP-30/gluconolactonase/LRE family protein n=1 Tax=unclassified Streptomyces TaxID=2593676 RepID=UPI00382759D0